MKNHTNSRPCLLRPGKKVKPIKLRCWLDMFNGVKHGKSALSDRKKCVFFCGISTCCELYAGTCSRTIYTIVTTTSSELFCVCAFLGVPLPWANDSKPFIIQRRIIRQKMCNYIFPSFNSGEDVFWPSVEVAPAVTSTKQIYSFGQTTYRRTPNGGGKNELKSAKRKVCEGFQFIRTHRVVFQHNFGFSICSKEWKILPLTINKVRIYWLYVYNSSFWWKRVSEEEKCFSLKYLLKLMFLIKNQGPVMAFFIKVGDPVN